MKNKILKIGMIPLAAALLLTGCDSFKALPTGYEAPMAVTDEGNKVDVYENIMKIIYDQTIVGQNETILNEVMSIIANDKLGSFADLEAAYNGTVADRVAYVNSHKELFTQSNDDKIIEQGITKDELYSNRVSDFYKSIEKKICKEIATKIMSSENVDDVSEKFDEFKFAFSIYSSMTIVTYPGYSDPTKSILDVTIPWYTNFIPSILEADYTYSKLNEYIHLLGTTNSITDGWYWNYINKDVLPSIWRDAIVEKYLIQNSYSAIGRAYARKVKAIKITASSVKEGESDLDIYKQKADDLMTTYAKNHILGEDHRQGHTEVNYIEFEKIENAWRGFKTFDKNKVFQPLDSEETSLLDDAGFTTDSITDPLFGETTFTYYKETKLGQIIEQYKIAKDAMGKRLLTSEESKVKSDFTSENTITIAEGLRNKVIELCKEHYVSEGWYTKNGTVSDNIPSAMQTRLFNINVANNVDHFEENEKEGYSVNTNYDPSNPKYNAENYVRMINGKYYLTPSKSEAAVFNPVNFVVADGNSMTITMVEEAVSSSKISLLGGANSYSVLRADEGPMFTERVVRDVADELSNKDTYVNSAYSNYISQYTMTYHDTSLFEFFESKFPELFEDD